MGGEGSKLNCCSSRKEGADSDLLANPSKATVAALPPGDQVELVRRALQSGNRDRIATILDYFNKCNECEGMANSAYKSSEVTRMLVDALKEDVEDLRPVIRRTTRLFTRQSGNQVYLAKQGAIQVVLGIMDKGNQLDREQVAGIIQNMALNEDNQKAIVAAGAIEQMIKMMKEGTDFHRAQAAGVLQNLALNAANLKPICESGAIEELCVSLNSDYEDGKIYAVGVMLNIAQNHDLLPRLAEAGVVPTAAKLLRTVGAKDDCKYLLRGLLLNLVTNEDIAVQLEAEGLDRKTVNSWRADPSE